MLTRTRPRVKPTRIAPRSRAPFAAGLLSAPILPLPDVDPMPTPLRASQEPQRVRWMAVDLTPLENLVEPDAEMCPSGAWRMPGEDWSWEIGFNTGDGR